MIDDGNGRPGGERAQAEVRRASAHRLMREARSLLIGAGAAPTLACLEDAIASIIAIGAADAEGEYVPLADGDSKPEPALVRATGGALAIIGTLLARRDLVSMEELGQLLEVFARVSEADDPAMGAIVARWGGMILQAAREIEPSGES